MDRTPSWLFVLARPPLAAPLGLTIAKAASSRSSCAFVSYDSRRTFHGNAVRTTKGGRDQEMAYAHM